MARLGRTPQRFHFPEDPRQYFELQKLNAPGRSDFLRLNMMGAMPSAQARYMWDHAVTGFCLKTEKGYVSHPGSDQKRDIKEEVWNGLDEREDDFLATCFLLQNRIVPTQQESLYEALVLVGREALPEDLWPLLADGSLAPTAEQAAAIARILGDDGGSVGEALGNSPASSGTSSTPDDAATEGMTVGLQGN